MRGLLIYRSTAASAAAAAVDDDLVLIRRVGKMYDHRST